MVNKTIIAIVMIIIVTIIAISVSVGPFSQIADPGKERMISDEPCDSDADCAAFDGAYCYQDLCAKDFDLIGYPVPEADVQ